MKVASDGSGRFLVVWSEASARASAAGYAFTLEAALLHCAAPR